MALASRPLGRSQPGLPGSFEMNQTGKLNEICILTLSNWLFKGLQWLIVHRGVCREASCGVHTAYTPTPRLNAAPGMVQAVRTPSKHISCCTNGVVFFVGQTAVSECLTDSRSSRLFSSLANRMPLRERCVGHNPTSPAKAVASGDVFCSLRITGVKCPRVWFLVPAYVWGAFARSCCVLADVIERGHLALPQWPSSGSAATSSTAALRAPASSLKAAA